MIAIKKMFLIVSCFLFLLTTNSIADEELYIGDSNLGIYIYSPNSTPIGYIVIDKSKHTETNLSKASTGKPNDYNSNQATWASKSFKEGWAYAYSNGSGLSSDGYSIISHTNKDLEKSSFSQTATNNNGLETTWEGGIGGGAYTGGDFGFAISQYEITVPKTQTPNQQLTGSAIVNKIPNGVISTSNAQIRR
jgi:hypothetical protein